MYEQWCQMSDEKITKKEFFRRFLMDIVFPKLKNQLIGLFFKKRLTKIFSVLTDVFTTPNADELENVESVEDIVKMILAKE